MIWRPELSGAAWPQTPAMWSPPESSQNIINVISFAFTTVCFVSHIASTSYGSSPLAECLINL